MATKRPRSPSPPPAKDNGTSQNIWISETIEDRSSIFVGYFSPSIPAKELQAHADIKSASHRMLGYRRPSKQRTIGSNLAILETGSDDDGENYGGKRVLKVLEAMNVEGSCVVARWYGGVMLGPVRFTHIETCARGAVSAWRKGWETEVAKKRKVEEEERERGVLVEELLERDQSIRVLRRLLEEKSKVANEARSSQTPAPVQMRKVDYEGLPLERLRVMDKARDGTIAFLLKRIDAAEKEKKEREKDGPTLGTTEAPEAPKAAEATEATKSAEAPGTTEHPGSLGAYETTEPPQAPETLKVPETSDRADSQQNKATDSAPKPGPFVESPSPE
ncbi:hypothetical protein M8818_007547 [Zalaria obscura]|uniref:Uncharacterized protein n=1 Tax=Zalaria obscura TaxID=2024903 RepID=A0ACC3S485_9PEZI